jgi:hypothetical protein
MTFSFSLDDRDPVGTIAVERRAHGDRAWRKTENGWEDCDPPRRSKSSHDGDAEMWYPEVDRFA